MGIAAQGGLLSFGHAAYFGIGAYTTAHFLRWLERADLLFPVIAVPLIGAVASAFFGFVIGLFTARKAHTAFAMISLAVGQLLYSLGAIATSISGGEAGIRLDRTVAWSPFVQMGNPIAMYSLAALWALLVIGAIALIRQTPYGKLANAVRENPERAEFIGVPARTVRLRSLVIASFFAGIAGSLYALNFEVVSLETLSLQLSGAVLLQVIAGGMRNFYGPVVGATVMTVANSQMNAYTEMGSLYLGIFFIVVVMFLKDGLIGWFVAARESSRAHGWRTVLAEAGLHLASIGLISTGFVLFVEKLHVAIQLWQQKPMLDVFIRAFMESNTLYTVIALIAVGMLLRPRWLRRLLKSSQIGRLPASSIAK